MSHVTTMLQNFANIIVFIMIANRIHPYLIRLNRPGKMMIGILFGLAGLISMQTPIEVQTGITIDFKAVLTGMSGLLGGPLSALASFLLIAGYRIFLGGDGMLPSLLCLAVAAAAGAYIYRWVNIRRIPFERIWWHPIMFGVFIAVVQLSTCWMFPPETRNYLLREFSLPLLIVYPVTCLVFHYFMTVEWFRHHDLLFDRLTQLPRYERVSGVWKRMIKRRRPFSLVILNVEKLRTVNDMYGIQAGNELLVQCARRLADNVPNGAVLSRFNGHDFAVSLPDADVIQALIWIVDVKKKLSAPYEIDGNPVYVTFSTGLAVYEGQPTSLEELFQQAETALRHAMDSGTNQTVSYETRLTEQLRYRTSLEKDLRFALERGQFHLNYQPQYELETGKLRGFEALLRWQHPDWGLISPAEFIPLAEDTGLIVPIGEWVMETACLMASKLNEMSTGATMAVNVSAVQLTEPHFPDKVAAILRSTGLAPEKLEIELTESTMVTSFDKAAEQLMRLKKIGVRLALDDFGVGYSSLSYLRRLPFDLIKIDRSFIEDIGRSRDDRMTKSIIDWVRELKYGIVAEGLESYDQLYWLKQWKCDIAQGYLFSKPMKEADLYRYLQETAPLPNPVFTADPNLPPS